MPIDYELDQGGSFVRVNATGHLTSEEINDFLLRLGEDPDLKPDHVTLFDTTQVTSEALTDLDFRQALVIERDNPEKLIARKLAIVVTTQAFIKHVMSYQNITPLIGEPTQVFSDVNEAMAWLNRQDPRGH